MLFSHQKKEILHFTITWVKLEDIMVSEISKTEKDKYCTLSLTRGKLRKTRIHRNKVSW